ncbi:hypothetical protein ACQ86E_28735 [Bradyrhizobium betae]|uniref:hypothetical protein n=1 Tax=Bradyrhizobium betae TaxID=244734 RepID=UPI003D671D01
MGNRTAKFISALVGGVIAGTPLAAVSQNAPTPAAATSTANAASDCLASPKGAAPQGQHWFYRLDRATKRQCWYLRAEGGKTTQSAQATADTPVAAPAAPQSVQNARAEYIAPQGAAAASAPAAVSVPPATQQSDISAQAPVATARWPDAATATPAQQPVTTPALTPALTAAQPSAKPAKAPTPVTLASAEAPADKPTGSLQTLLLVIVGALALAGLLASVIYRFAGGRVRVQTGDRRVNWDHREPQDQDDSRAPWLEASTAAASRAERSRPVDFDAARAQAPQVAAFSNAIARVASQARPARAEAAEPDETEIPVFTGEFEIETPAPQLAANDVHDEEPADRDDDARHDVANHDVANHDVAVDIDIITAMLERLAQEGPRLSQPSLEAGLEDLARSPRGQSAARA